jgi:hypothetical protein
MWVIPGKASAKVDGKLVSVECTIGINGNATDIIANIEAKAFRSLAKRLWLKVSSIELEDGDADDTLPTQDNQHPAAITEQLRDIAINSRPSASESHAGDYGRCIKMLSSDPSAASVFQDIWKTIADVKTLEELDAIAKDSATLFWTFSRDVQGKIKAFSGDRRKELTEAANG